MARLHEVEEHVRLKDEKMKEFEAVVLLISIYLIILICTSNALFLSCRNFLESVCLLYLARCSAKLNFTRSSKRRGGTVGKVKANPFYLYQYCDSASA